MHTPDRLLAVAHAVVAAEHLWRPVVRHDPHERWYTCLHRDTDLEVWLLGWEVGQDTRVHDHGGSCGAFVVAEGTLDEQHTSRDRRGPLLRRSHAAGRGAAFGATYVHDLANLGPAAVSSVHAYSPPLGTMTYYEMVDGLPTVARRAPAEVGT